MSDEAPNRNELDIIRDFNDAAEGIEDRYSSLTFTAAGDRLARRYGILMNAAQNGVERAELMESMAGVLDHFTKQPFEAQDSLRNYEVATRVLQRLGAAFIDNIRADTVPGHFTTDQLDFLSGHLKSAAQIREDMAGYFPNRPNSAAIAEQGEAYRRLATDIDRVSAKFADAPKSSRPGRRDGGDRPVRTRF